MKYVFEVTVHFAYKSGNPDVSFDHKVITVATDDVIARELAVKNLHKNEGKNVDVLFCEISMTGVVEEEE